MTNLKTILSAIFTFTAIAIFGQTNDSKADQKAYIEVIGYAEKEVIPDEIYIAITIREKYVNKTKVTIEEQEEKLIHALKELSIELSNLSLADANADYVKIRWQKKDVITKKDYSLKVASATAVGEVFQELEKIEITDASISKVSHSKIDSLRKEVRIMAIKDAKEKADYLLTAIGEQTGKALIVTENTMATTVTREEIAKLPVRSTAGIYNGASSSSYVEKDKEIQFRKIKLASGIYVKFSIQ